MKDMFEKYCRFLERDNQEHKNKTPFYLLSQKFENNKLDYYEFIDKMNHGYKPLFYLAKHLEHVNIEKIEIAENNIIFTTKEEGIKLLFNGMDRRGVPFEILTWGDYEKQEQEILSKVMFDGMVILDVGANLGWFSLLWGKTFKNSTIHAFEPIKETFDYCLANVMLNGLENIQVHNFGLSNENAEMPFFYAPECAALASNKNIMNYKNSKRISCDVYALDKLVTKIELSQVDLIKCDVEGAELRVLEGGVSVISENLPVIVLELYHEWTKHYDYHPDEVFRFLGALGYRAFLPKNDGLRVISKYCGEDFTNQNYFFLNKEKHSELIKLLCSEVSH